MDIDLNDPLTLRDPYPAYARIREAGACVRNERAGVWMVARHAEAMSVLNDGDTYSSSVLAEDPGPWFGESPTMISSDGDIHKRLRSAVRHAFTARRMAHREKVIREVVTEQFSQARVDERLRSGETVDLASEVLARVPILVTAQLLGIPSDWLDAFTEVANALVVYTGAGEASTDSVDMRAARSAAVAANEVLWTWTQERLRTGPADERDVLSSLSRAVRDGLLAPDEAVATVVLLILAGTDSSMKFLTMAVRLLVLHPEARKQLEATGHATVDIVEEFVRFGGPVQLDARRATRRHVLAGTTIAAGDDVWVLTAAANRDHRVFADPDRLLLDRPPTPNLGFGWGRHYCLGAPAARLQTAAVLDRFLELPNELEVVSTEWGRGMFVRGPVSLTLRAVRPPK
ncbi:cytochrome P450 [Streptomyces sp. NPDC050388]|uniref:cytochrome P450 n=1 Tax=Streptomyces sp. NPDC050388 TaxID=3155781 RepID=UPI00342A1CD5